MSAPRQRGWFVTAIILDSTHPVGPAPAGVVPAFFGMERHTGRRPRASGGGSTTGCCGPSVRTSAPRQRGWFSPPALWRRSSPVGPAPAGVVRAAARRRTSSRSRPRASGGGSPAPEWHVRDTGSAPRQRGWFRGQPRQRGRDPVGPAPAGVVHPAGSAPRDRVRRPRASGGGSRPTRILDRAGRSAPRQRGWFACRCLPPSRDRVGPAPAGVVPGARVRRTGPPGRPRASGGGSPHRMIDATRTQSAPRQRGWFYVGWPYVASARVGPAPAGVVRRGCPSGRPSGRRPRASGGGSCLAAHTARFSSSAPRQRGWFLPAVLGRGRYWVGPAPAGVVPASSSSTRAPARRPRASGGGS